MSGYKAFVSLNSAAGNRSLFFRTDLVLFDFYLNLKKNNSDFRKKFRKIPCSLKKDHSTKFFNLVVFVSLK